MVYQCPWFQENEKQSAHVDDSQSPKKHPQNRFFRSTEPPSLLPSLASKEKLPTWSNVIHTVPGESHFDIPRNGNLFFELWRLVQPFVIWKRRKPFSGNESLATFSRRNTPFEDSESKRAAWDFLHELRWCDLWVIACRGHARNWQELGACQRTVLILYTCDLRVLRFFASLQEKFSHLKIKHYTWYTWRVCTCRRKYP